MARKILQEEFDSEIDTDSHIRFVDFLVIIVKEPIGIAIIILLLLFFICLNITSKSENIGNVHKDKKIKTKL